MKDDFNINNKKGKKGKNKLVLTAVSVPTVLAIEYSKDDMMWTEFATVLMPKGIDGTITFRMKLKG